MGMKQERKREEQKKLMYYRIIIIFGIIYLLTFLTSDTEHLPTIAETMRFSLHMISRLGDLLNIIGRTLNKSE